MLAIKNLVSKSSIYRHSTMLMGTRFEITVVGENPGWATERINEAIAEINRVDKLLSTFGDDSTVNQVNRNAGVAPVKVNGELFRLIDRSLQIAELTYGTFDITYSAGQKTVAGVSYKDVMLNTAEQTVFLLQEGMRISFAASGKGYAADRAKFILQMSGVNSGVINAGGDMIAWGTQPDREPWTVAAADPEQADKPYAQLNISNQALATSVNVDAVTAKKNVTAVTNKGFEVSAIKSVTIMSPTAELADAMAAPVISIGVNAGLYLINRLNQVACVIVDDHDRVYTSKSITL
ncbi:FAD:protein FMN transferase [Mucilaginibacter defluvii]|uniref:FAD:protein FMN transferase n=1 Tax=Mucilaginibacter defluvii TaxID=1196019 RepID=A0ABP9G000_9SPHI